MTFDNIDERLEGHYSCDNEDCGSSDALCIYKYGNSSNDYYSHCFSCDTHVNVRSEEWVRNKIMSNEKDNLDSISRVSFEVNDTSLGYASIVDRGITKETCKKFGVQVEYDKEKGEIVKHHYPYSNSKGEIIGSKIRIVKDKRFYLEGDKPEFTLFGQQLFPAGSHSSITITEGELDALAAFEMNGRRFPVVSVPNGAQSAVKSCRKSYEYLDSFDKIVLAFDNDAPGKQAAQQVAQLFTPGKVFIMNLNFKDPCEYLSNGNVSAFVSDWFNAGSYSQAGIVFGDELIHRIKNKPEVQSVEYPWQSLNNMLYGVRKQEMVLILAETGIGKSTIMKEILFHLWEKTNANIGGFFLEENVEYTGESIASIHADIPFHLPDSNFTIEEYDNSLNTILGDNRIKLYDHFGSMAVEEIYKKMQYFVKGLGCEYIFLDHISILVSEQNEGDERKALDQLASKLKKMTMELDIGLFLVSHVNDHGQPRGSRAVTHLANSIIRAERDPFHDTPSQRNIIKLRVEKNRFSGKQGPAGLLYYDQFTGRLNEIEPASIGDISNPPFMVADEADVNKL